MHNSALGALRHQQHHRSSTSFQIITVLPVLFLLIKYDEGLDKDAFVTALLALEQPPEGDRFPMMLICTFPSRECLLANALLGKRLSWLVYPGA
jgi:hypothetical protein